MTLIKEDIVRLLSVSAGTEVEQSKNLIQVLLRVIKETLAKGDDVLISGFGQFKQRHKKPRIGRNPKSGIEYKITERDVVTFYPSKVFRKELNN